MWSGCVFILFYFVGHFNTLHRLLQLIYIILDIVVNIYIYIQDGILTNTGPGETFFVPNWQV